MSNSAASVSPRSMVTLCWKPPVPYPVGPPRRGAFRHREQAAITRQDRSAMRKRIIRIGGNPRLMTCFLLGRPSPKPLSLENPMSTAYPLDLEREIDRDGFTGLCPSIVPCP
jgi:hypothetical protein